MSEFDDDPLEDGADRVATPVGYQRPPVAYQFQKGASGNPRGRPPKRLPEDTPRVGKETLDDLILREASRLVDIREGAKTHRLTVKEAAVRSRALSAIKGQPRAQSEFLKSLREAESRKREEDIAFIKEFEAISAGVRRRFSSLKNTAEYDGLLPHPLEYAIDRRTGDVFCNAPQNDKQSNIWATIVELRLWAQSVIEFRQAKLEKGSLRPKEDANAIRNAQFLYDVSSHAIPDVATRRAVGFDIREWYAENHPKCVDIYNYYLLGGFPRQDDYNKYFSSDGTPRAFSLPGFMEIFPHPRTIELCRRRHLIRPTKYGPLD